MQQCMKGQLENADSAYGFYYGAIVSADHAMKVEFERQQASFLSPVNATMRHETLQHI